jgi:hypothetical protein
VEGLKIGLKSDTVANYGKRVRGDHCKEVLSDVETRLKEGTELVLEGRGHKLQL